MLTSNDPLYKKRINQLKYELNIDKGIIEKVLQLNFEYIRNKLIVEIPEDKLLTKEEFENIMPVIKVPTLGYFKGNYYKYKRIFENRQKKLNNKNK